MIIETFVGPSVFDPTTGSFVFEIDVPKTAKVIAVEFARYDGVNGETQVHVVR